MKIKENDIVKLSIEDDGILYSSFKKPFVMTLDVLKEMISLRHEISDGEKQFWCLSLKNVNYYTKEARDYADIYGQDFLHACAVIVESKLSMFTFNVFFILKKTKIPYRGFTDIEEAKKWLKDPALLNPNKNSLFYYSEQKDSK